MTVKELKDRLTNVPEDTLIRFVTERTDSLLADYYRVDWMAYIECLDEEGQRYLYMAQ